MTEKKGYKPTIILLGKHNTSYKESMLSMNYGKSNNTYLEILHRSPHHHSIYKQNVQKQQSTQFLQENGKRQTDYDIRAEAPATFLQKGAGHQKFMHTTCTIQGIYLG
jgi:hypothetical protein